MRLKSVLPVLVLLLGAAVAAYLLNNRPEVKRHARKVATPTVEVIQLQPQDYRIEIESQGTVTPHTQTQLVAEVRGKVTEVAEQFRSGGFFDKGDVLLRIDDRDYVNAVTIADAELAKARVALREEQARAEQARLDWERLGSGEAPSPLVLRKPQLDSARAAVAAAEARLRQARTDLERTRLVAPYSGRVLEKKADMGQFLTPGSVVGSVYATDYVEVELPLSEDELKWLDMPLVRPGGNPDITGPEVRLHNGGNEWQGHIVRATGAVDTRTRQQSVVARVDAPYASQKQPLQIGQFVTATIAGPVLKGVYVIPRPAVRGGNEIMMVDSENKLKRLKVTPTWVGKDDVVVKNLTKDLKLVTTPVSYLVDDTEVKIAGDNGDVDKGEPQSQE